MSSTQPPVSSAISPTEEDRPPAPLSVMALYRPRSRARRMKSYILRWVMGSPICTAVAGEPSCSSSEEKVAP